MPERAFGTRPTIKLNGTELSGQVEPNIVDVVVETDLNAPGSCTITFTDPERNILDTVGVDFLQDLEISASAVEESDEHPLFVGHVYGFDFMADNDAGSFAIIQAYDATYRLKQSRRVKTYRDVTDGDVVNELARDAGIETGTVEGGSVVHNHLAQVNETDWDFLHRLAEASDCTMYVKDGKLEFTTSTEASDAPSPGDFGSTDPLQLTAGHNLTYFRVRTTASQQVGEIEVRGWDPSTKDVVVANAKAETRSVSIDGKPADVGNQHGSEKRVASFPQFTEQALCDAMAKSIADRVAGTFGYGEGQAIGDPRLRAGVAVSIGQTGRFDGQYTLTSTRHVFGKEGYKTDFVVSGEHDRTVHGLSVHDGGGEYNRFDSVYPAVVTQVEDPDKLGRVKVKMPWLSGDYEGDWARVMQIGAGPERGLLWLPEVDDEVLVAHIGGDPGSPVVIGGLWNGVDTPPFEGFDDPHDGEVDTRGMRTRAGHELVFNDKSGEESITMKTGDGKLSITLDQAGGKVILDCGGDVELTSQGDLTLSASGNGSFKADGGLKLESGGQVEVSGAMIKLN